MDKQQQLRRSRQQLHKCISAFSIKNVVTSWHFPTFAAPPHKVKSRSLSNHLQIQALYQEKRRKERKQIQASNSSHALVFVEQRQQITPLQSHRSNICTLNIPKQQGYSTTKHVRHKPIQDSAPVDQFEELESVILDERFIMSGIETDENGSPRESYQNIPIRRKIKLQSMGQAPVILQPPPIKKIVFNIKKQHTDSQQIAIQLPPPPPKIKLKRSGEFNNYLEKYGGDVDQTIIKSRNTLTNRNILYKSESGLHVVSKSSTNFNKPKSYFNIIKRDAQPRKVEERYFQNRYYANNFVGTPLMHQIMKTKNLTLSTLVKDF
ncbi:hypothetical protein FGO68_gene10273 [Halteria grandinella]|uniref:Uncharacterized protein n=1 Tax=Halteria grandinella TaxID=5974 RepID=A0A8J8T090_HALGN|nr:hypothetical protein FGO68_gene10273 [Halteria grandinella]